jgi:hypothetical protein
MNAVTFLRPDPPRPETWDRADMPAALHRRDWTRVFRLLQKVGHSQQVIARYTEQSQPEVSAIIHGRRVMAYDVQKRMALGLGIPLCRIGLGTCCACCSHDIPSDHDTNLLILPSGPLEIRRQPIALPPVE